jgi:hypothetical protein
MNLTIFISDRRINPRLNMRGGFLHNPTSGANMNSHPDFINPIAPAALEVPTFQGGFFFMGLEISSETAHPTTHVKLRD